MANRRQGQYEVVVRNRPRELAKFTGRLVKDGVEFQRLTIATVGDKALVRISPSLR